MDYKSDGLYSIRHRRKLCNTVDPNAVSQSLMMSTSSLNQLQHQVFGGAHFAHSWTNPRPLRLALNRSPTHPLAHSYFEHLTGLGLGDWSNRLPLACSVLKIRDNLSANGSDPFRHSSACAPPPTVIAKQPLYPLTFTRTQSFIDVTTTSEAMHMGLLDWWITFAAGVLSVGGKLSGSQHS